LIASNWIMSSTILSHGNLLVREILSSIDPSSPGKPGAVMQHIRSFSRALLEPRASTQPTSHEAEQEILYVVDGQGTLETGGETWYLREGSMFLIPSGLRHTLRNTEDYPLELLIIVEELSRGHEKRAASVVARDRREVPVVMAHWKMKVAALLSDVDDLARLHSVLVVTIDPMEATEPHGHPVGTDEVWYLLEGCGLHIVGEDLTRQWPGDAVYIREQSHAIVNDGNEPLRMFYFAHYGGR